MSRCHMLGVRSARAVCVLDGVVLRELFWQAPSRFSHHCVRQKPPLCGSIATARYHWFKSQRILRSLLSRATWNATFTSAKNCTPFLSVKRRISVLSRGFLCPGFPGHEWAINPWTPRAYAVDDLGTCTAETDNGFLYRAETGQGPCTSPFVLSGGTTIFHATLFSHTPSRTKCWRSLFCRRVCLPKQLVYLLPWCIAGLKRTIAIRMLLIFLTIHFFPFSFAGTEQFWHPNWLITLTSRRTRE